MGKHLRHPATVIAALALFVALGGGAAWAGGLIPGSRIKNHSISSRKLTKRAITSLRGMRGPTGLQGPQGAPGTSSGDSPAPANARVAASRARDRGRCDPRRDGPAQLDPDRPSRTPRRRQPRPQRRVNPSLGQCSGMTPDGPRSLCWDIRDAR